MCVCVYMYIHTHTETYIHIYILYMGKNFINKIQKQKNPLLESVLSWEITPPYTLPENKKYPNDVKQSVHNLPKQTPDCF